MVVAPGIIQPVVGPPVLASKAIVPLFTTEEASVIINIAKALPASPIILKVAPLLTVKLLTLTCTLLTVMVPEEMTGSGVEPACMYTSSALVGKAPVVQLLAVFQSLLVVPVQYTTAADTTCGKNIAIINKQYKYDCLSEPATDCACKAQK